MYTPRPFHHNIHEAEFTITGGLNVQRISSLSMDVIDRVGCWLFYFDVCAIYCIQTLRELSNLPLNFIGHLDNFLPFSASSLLPFCIFCIYLHKMPHHCTCPSSLSRFRLRGPFEYIFECRASFWVSIKTCDSIKKRNSIREKMYPNLIYRGTK